MSVVQQMKNIYQVICDGCGRAARVSLCQRWAQVFACGDGFTADSGHWLCPSCADEEKMGLKLPLQKMKERDGKRAAEKTA